MKIFRFALILGYVFTLVSPTPAMPASVAYTMKLPTGEQARVFNDGIVELRSKAGVEFRAYQPVPHYGDLEPAYNLPDRSKLIADLMRRPQKPFADNRVIIVLRDGASIDDLRMHRAFAAIGVDRSERLFHSISPGLLTAMHAQAQARVAHPLLNPANAYRVHITNTSVRDAVAQLSEIPSIAYVSPDWTVGPMHSDGMTIPSSAVDEARTNAATLQPSSTTLPANYALSSSAQSLLNAPSDNAAAAFDEISRAFHEIPGQGEIITNVSIGDIDDARAATRATDPCNSSVTINGPTTEMLNGQHYIDWPSMPLIPAYTADSNGNLSGNDEVCGNDPALTEVGLDFSVMAPLPHNLQRSGELGSGYTDLLGIAPGAHYRLIVPSATSPAISDVDAALLAAASQSPRPDVISASIGLPYDEFGFPSRYLEDDPLSQAIITALVNAYGTVVVIAGGDGTRASFSQASIGPSGGSSATDVVAPGGTATSLNDVYATTVPSSDIDSGSIDAGGTTLDDIFADPPQNAAFAAQSGQHAFAETRWTGFTNFSSGFGSRVDVSAPADNVLSFEHGCTSGACPVDAVAVTLEGGTSASAPEIAAASAVALQVARLTGHPFAHPTDVRAFLKSTATPVTAVSQADVALNVGPQVNLAHMVEKLLANAGKTVPLGVARIGVEQRRRVDYTDDAFISDTDSAKIDISGPTETLFGRSIPTGWNRLAWVTIAPDWEGATPSTTYRLVAANRPSVAISTKPWVRMSAGQLLKAAGIAYPNRSDETIHLTYSAVSRGRRAEEKVALTFSPAATSSLQVLAPIVPSVVTGATIPVKWNLSDWDASLVTGGPELAISHPGRTNYATGSLYNPILTIPLSGKSGVVEIPVSKLQGGGIYGIQIFAAKGTFIASDPAFTRVQPSDTATRPNAPLLSRRDHSASGHFIEIPYDMPFDVAYDLSNVPGATSAEIEISAPGPAIPQLYNTFNNPNGTQRDDNGVDTGSVHIVRVEGRAGTVTIDPRSANMTGAMTHLVRVIPLKSGAAVGEASDVSTVQNDGLIPPDGGILNYGFGVSGNGVDGFFTSEHVLASGTMLGSAYTFDEKTNTVRRVLSSSTWTLPFTLGPGVWDDIGILAQTSYPSGTSTVFNALDPVSKGVLGSAWTPPSTFAIDGAGTSKGNGTGAFLASDSTGSGNDVFRIFTSNIVANSFSKPIDISQPVLGLTEPQDEGYSENVSTNVFATAFSSGVATSGTCAPPTIVLTNLATGKSDAFNGLGHATGAQIAIDSSTNRAVVTTNCDDGFSIYDLATHVGSEKTLSFAATFPIADSAHHLFLVTQGIPPDYGVNNNSMSRVLIYSEQGKLLSAKEEFNFVNDLWFYRQNNLQVDASQRTGYTFGPSQAQLQPFSY